MSKAENDAHWADERNWSAGPKGLALYFCHQDSRTWVPKRTPWTGMTLNLAQAGGAAWLLACFLVFWAIGLAFGGLLGFLLGAGL